MTDGRASFGVLLARFEDTAGQTQRALAEQQAQLTAILERAAEVARTVADPEAAAYEVEQVQRETGVRIAEAQSAQASAERDAREARRRAEQKAELRAQADEAAEERAALRQEARQQLDAVLARFNTAAPAEQGEAGTAGTGSTPTARRRGKTTE
ncbi:hypothetical protein [Pseudonocardia nigra]|uniref:hypothetical protein n=1 Tax=Pseudonocardia nigra TaxID=1921578 RepID=UPI001C5D7679|nr:hypothetical protein [Pseudonocardia nigra]